MYNFKKHTNNDNGMRVKWNIMKAQDKEADLMPMTVADMEFMTAPEITDKLVEYIQNQPLGYTEPNAYFYEVISKWYRDMHQIEVNPKHIFLDSGVISALHASLQAFTKPHDRICVLTPAYPQFFRVIKAVDRELITSDLINDNGYYHINFDQLESIFKDPRVTAFILCNPHNPVGRVWTYDELNQIHKLASAYNVLVFSDEIHCDILLPGYTHIVYQTVDPNSIVFSSASKTFNLAALQASFLIINNKAQIDLWQAYQKTRGTHGPNALGIVATQAAFELGHKWHQSMLKVIAENYHTVCTVLKDTKLRISPLEGTYLVWIDCTAYGPQIFKQLHKEHLHFHLGSNFGEAGKGFVRMNIAVPHDILVEVLSRLVKIVNELQ